MTTHQLDAHRRRRTLIAGGGVALVLIVIAVLVGVGLAQKSTNTSGPSTRASSSEVKDITSIPASTYDAVGAGSGSVISIPTTLESAAMTAGGKPRILYVGAEWCPFCAAQRWALAAALSRFGTFSDLGSTTSSSTDVYPSTPTLSFHGATYSSPYLVFSAFEVQDNQHRTLDMPPAADVKTFLTYGRAFPFIDLAGKYKVGAMYSPGILHASPTDEFSGPLPRATIIGALSNPNSPITQSIVGSANVLTATLCKLTDQKLASVCASPGVLAARS